MKTTGIIILIAGIGLTAFTSFKFFTKEKVVDIGALEITRDKPHYMNWSPLLGIALIGIGGLVLWQGTKK
ncbi:MAG: LPXTG cell wall anchor domain-containing protein [Bacteroidetes bacterium]|nr:LPXTG cell wall anchor domain-containing protein [Bacteroidota bacterium]